MPSIAETLCSEELCVPAGDEVSEASGDCEAPPASRPRLATTPEANNTANHIDNHQTPADDTPKVNGMSNGYESDSNGTNDVNDNEVEEEMPPIPPIKELSPEELAEKMKLVHRLQVELRNEEMKLVLLKKVRQSQVRPAATASRVDTGRVNIQDFRTQVVPGSC